MKSSAPFLLIALIVTTLIAPLCAAEPAIPDDVIFERGVEFANPDNQHLQLDIARPKNGEVSTPLNCDRFVWLSRLLTFKVRAISGPPERLLPPGPP